MPKNAVKDALKLKSHVRSRATIKIPLKPDSDRITIVDTESAKSTITLKPSPNATSWRSQ